MRTRLMRDSKKLFVAIRTKRCMVCARGTVDAPQQVGHALAHAVKECDKIVRWQKVPQTAEVELRANVRVAAHDLRGVRAVLCIVRVVRAQPAVQKLVPSERRAAGVQTFRQVRFARNFVFVRAQQPLKRIAQKDADSPARAWSPKGVKELA